MSDNSRIAKNTILLYVRMILMLFVGLYTSRVVLDALGINDYGIYNVVGGVVSMFTFLNSAMAGVSERYITFALGKNDSRELHKIFCTTVNMHIAIALVVLIFAEIIGIWLLFNKLVIPADRLMPAFWVFQASMLSTFVMMISIPYNGTIIAHEKMSAFAYISLFEAFSKLFIAFILQILPTDKLISYAVLVLIIQISIRFIYTWYCKKHFSECVYEMIVDKSIFKEMLSFGSWNLFGNLANVGMTQGVNILLNMFLGPAVNAARGLAVQVEGCINGFVGNFQTALNPQIIKSYASDELERMHSLICASGRYSFYLLLIIAFPVILQIDYLIALWLNDVPEHTANFIRLILITNLFNTPVGAINIASQSTGKVRNVQVIIGSIYLLIVPLSYVVLKQHLVPELVYVVLFIITIIAQFTRLNIVAKQIKLSIMTYTQKVYWPMLKVLIPNVIYAILSLKFFIANNFLSLIINSTLSILFVATTIYLFGINKTERQIFYDKLKFIIKKH